MFVPFICRWFRSCSGMRVGVARQAGGARVPHQVGTGSPFVSFSFFFFSLFLFRFSTPTRSEPLDPTAQIMCLFIVVGQRLVGLKFGQKSGCWLGTILKLYPERDVYFLPSSVYIGAQGQKINFDILNSSLQRRAILQRGNCRCIKALR